MSINNKPATGGAKFIQFKMDDAYLATPWLHIFEKHQGWNGNDPFYQINIVVRKTNEVIAPIIQQLRNYEKNKVIRTGFFPIIRELDMKKHEQEIDIFTKNNLNVRDYCALSCKRKVSKPVLISRDAVALQDSPEVRELFKRGCKVNVIFALGVHNMGQPFFYLTSIQHVGDGFSKFFKDQAPKMQFNPVMPSEDEFSRKAPKSNLGINGQPAMAPKNKEEEEMFNQIIDISLEDTAGL